MTPKIETDIPAIVRDLVEIIPEAHKAGWTANPQAWIHDGTEWARLIGIASAEELYNECRFIFPTAAAYLHRYHVASNQAIVATIESTDETAFAAVYEIHGNELKLMFLQPTKFQHIVPVPHE